MTGNSVLQKLRWRDGLRGLVIDAPATYRRLLDKAGVQIEFDGEIGSGYEFIHVFATTTDRLRELGPLLAKVATPGLLLWVSYPKGSSIPTDLKRDVVWEVLSTFGIRPVMQVAIDEVWSALRFRPA